MIFTSSDIYSLQSTSEQEQEAFDVEFVARMKFTGGLRPATSEELSAARDLFKPSPDAEPVPAFVDKGRWIIQCPACGAGKAVHYGHKKAACLECLTVHVVKFPTKAQRETAEALLIQRPNLANRNWFPFDMDHGGRKVKAETVTMLEMEQILILRDDLIALEGKDLVKELGATTAGKIFELGLRSAPELPSGK